MTSNVGASTIGRQKTLGFSIAKGDEEEKSQYEKMKENIMGELKQRFRPEFLNRIDDIIVFHSLNENHISKIVLLMAAKLQERLKEMDIKLEMSDEAVKLISKSGFDLEYGARPLKRYIGNTLETIIAKKLIAGDVYKRQNFHRSR